MSCPQECVGCRHMYSITGRYCCRKYLNYCESVVILCRIQNEVDDKYESNEDFLHEN
jgi:hypothetical protein